MRYVYKGCAEQNYEWREFLEYEMRYVYKGCAEKNYELPELLEYKMCNMNEE